MRNGTWLQRVLYLLMAVLSTYLLYKGGRVLIRQADQVPDEWKRRLEDRAVETLAPAYSAAARGIQSGNWISEWMEQLVPVYTYLAERQGEDESEGSLEEKETETKRETEEESEAAATQAAAPALSGITAEQLSRLSDYSYLLNQYFTVDAGTSIDETLLDAEALLGEDLTIQKNPEVPQILIYHTHSQETFADSREGAVEDSIVGMGDTLAEILEEQYGYRVLHDTGVYDLRDGVLDRSAAYDYARASIEEILEENPSIEVIIDLHRDGVEGEKFVTEIDGKPTSMIMFFNGISRDSQGNPLSWLQNSYIRENLAFSLQLELKAREQYPGFTRNIYLKAQRYNLHLRPRSLLIEAGTQLNTVEEERNAMKPLAELLDQVLTGR